MGKLLNDIEIFDYRVTSLTDSSIQKFLDTADTILTKIDRADLKAPIFYFIREIANNAERANIKRLYFQSNNLDINDPFDYHKGMLSFSASFQENLEKYRKKMEKTNHYIHFKMYIIDNCLKIEVTNSGMPTKSEYSRITARAERAKSVSDIGEAYLLFNDLSESGGLGIITICLMLRNLGVYEDGFSFKIDQETQESIVRITVPLSAVNDAQMNYISNEIKHEIESIPKIPDHIRLIEKMLSDPDIDFDEVSKVIYRDPGLTVDLLKMMNSAHFMLPEKVTSINEAVRFIGIRGLKLMVLAYGVETVLKEKYGHITDLLEHAYRCAVYSYLLALHFGKHIIMETTYLSSLLHDLGKIVLRTIHPDAVHRIQKYCTQNGIRGDIMETLAMGVNHARVGALVARHWELPEIIIEGIENHHQPLIASKDSRDVVYIVYLADIFANMDQYDPIDFHTVETDVLSHFDIIGKEYFDDLYEKMRLRYDQHTDQ